MNASQLRRARRASLGTLLLPLAVAGCSGGASKYTDTRYHLHLELPSGWSAPATGAVGTTTSGLAYVIHFTNPPGMRILVQAPIPGLTGVTNGRVVTNDAKHGCPIKCVFTTFRVHALPAVLVRQYDTSDRLTSDYAGINTTRNSYQFELQTGNTISSSLEGQFKAVVKSFRPGPNG